MSDLVLRLVSWMPNVWYLCEVVTLQSADKLRQNSLHFNKTVCIIINSIKTVYICPLQHNDSCDLIYFANQSFNQQIKKSFAGIVSNQPTSTITINGINPSRFIPSPACVMMVVIIFVSLTHLLICFCILQRLLFYLSGCTSCHQICRADPLCQSLLRQTKIFSQV